MQGLARELFHRSGGRSICSAATATGAPWVLEVKRVRATVHAVEQLTRYLQQVDRNAGHAPARGVLVAPDLAPQARVLLEDRGYDFIPLDEILARCGDEAEDLMRLF